ncbi:MAG: tRNA pseudouridine(38-40) synthase TruA [Bdellovibrionia bacterium]
MPKIKFTVSYDGTDYCGWQIQKHGDKPSVAQVISEVLNKVCDEPIALYASGRTDAGVHALNQVCHFETSRPISPEGKWDFVWAMNCLLPPTIVVKKAWLAPDEFHSTLSATHKTYRYFLLNQPRPSAILSRYADWVRKPMDIDLLNNCAEQILGTHDFKSFQSAGTPVPHTVRDIYKAQWTYRKPHLLQFEVTGSGFLKQMVRNLVGTMTMIERKGMQASEMTKILKSEDRTKAGAPAPPQGLFLYRVYYPQDLDNKCLEL